MDIPGLASMLMYNNSASPISLVCNPSYNVTSPTDLSNNFLFPNNYGISFLIISQTLKHIWDMFDFNTTSNPHSYLALFVLKTLLEVWYFTMDLIPSNLHGYLALIESKSVVIFICFCCLIISFKLFIKSELLCSVSLLKHLLRDLFNYSFCHFIYLRLVNTL